MLGQKQGSRYGGFVTGVVWFYLLIQRNYLHGDLPTKLNYYTFLLLQILLWPLERHRLEAKEETGCNHQDPLDCAPSTSAKHNRYLQGIAPIDAQRKNIELLTFSCSRGSSWVGAPLPRYGRHGWKKSHQTL